MIKQNTKKVVKGVNRVPVKDRAKDFWEDLSNGLYKKKTGRLEWRVHGSEQWKIRIFWVGMTEDPDRQAREYIFDLIHLRLLNKDDERKCMF